MSATVNPAGAPFVQQSPESKPRAREPFVRDPVKVTQEKKSEQSESDAREEGQEA